MIADVAASIRARLLNQAKAKREEFELTLTRFAAECLLFRLGASTARDRCILKGATLLSVWLSDPYRSTRDVEAEMGTLLTMLNYFSTLGNGSAPVPTLEFAPRDRSYSS